MYGRFAWAVIGPALVIHAAPASAQIWTFNSLRATANPGPGCPDGLPCGRQGIQRDWVVPVSGNYKLTLAGGEGGPGAEGRAGIYNSVPGGAGAVMSGLFNLSAGTQLVIVAAQAGRAGRGALSTRSGGGGGGGSFVFSVPQLTLKFDDASKVFDLNDSILLAAAGGGGGTTRVGTNEATTPGSVFDFLGVDVGGPGLAGRDGGATFRTVNGQRLLNSYYGGVNGDAAGRYYLGDVFNPNGIYDSCTNSGASYRVTSYYPTPYDPNSLDPCTPSTVSYSIEGGFVGGSGRQFADGGFGGGGEGTTEGLYYVFNGTSGGGGGGYSGGGGGFYGFGSGGGGGSYISDDATFLSGISGANRGNGWVTIEYMAAVPEPASWAMLIGGFGLTGAAMRRRRALA
jgi:hypothetical protein